ncbi:MAG TPA: cell filamentation protein Fic [Candidatus Wallbacteria bacterium]|nr:cell filamentation protein Fic [Candidatus Wallbacteria bacterium]
MSRYCYKDTDILINNYKVFDRDLLNRIERDITDLKLTELQIKPVKGSFNLTHFKAIHKFIFGDIYPFAGKIRREDIFKGATMFAKYYLVNDGLKKLFSELAVENHLKEICAEKLPRRLAHYMAELNMLHPFCEGNGRAIREFIRELALGCGYEVNWYVLDKSQLLTAMKASAIFGNESLERLLKTALVRDEYAMQEAK